MKLEFYSMRGTGTIWSVQYMRACAAFAVVAYHQLHLKIPIANFGQYGVDLFFVISGFIMFTLTDRNDTGPRRFALDRISRIVPVYWVLTILAFMLAAVDLGPYGASTDIGLLSRSLAFIPTENSVGRPFPMLFVGWTLDCEMLFYALFCACLFLPSALRLPSLGVALIALVLAGNAIGASPASHLVLFNPILWEFLAGCIIGAAYGSERHAKWAPIVGFVIIIILFWLGHIYPRLTFGAFAAIIVVLALQTERVGLVPRIRPLKFVGDASYSIYLMQVFILPIGLVWHSDVGIISLAIAAGCLTHVLFERPLIRITRRAFAAASRTPEPAAV